MERDRTTGRCWAALAMLGAISVGGCAGAGHPAGQPTPADSDASGARFVLPPVVVSGWTALGAPVGIRLESQGAGVRVDDGRLVTDAEAPVTARVTATFEADDAAAAGPDGPDGPVTKTFQVTVLPEAAARSLFAYTRVPLDRDTYSAAVANSMHLALGERTGRSRIESEVLNENYGVLFARAVPTDRVDFNEVRTLQAPYVFHRGDGGFGVVATRAMADGTRDASADTALLYFTSPDLLTYTEVGLVGLGTNGGVHDPGARWDSALEQYLVWWTDDAGALHHTTFDDLARPETRGAVGSGGPVPEIPTFAGREPGPGDPVNSRMIPISRDAARGLEVRFGRIVNTGVEVPEVTVEAGAALSLDDVTATLMYSDGSTAERAVDWDEADVAAVDPSEPGTYTVAGTIRAPEYPFPFIPARADPTIAEYDGTYYFIATDDTEGGHVGSPGIPLRAADRIMGLRSAPEHKILSTGPADIAGCFWAPELHEFAGTLHVFFAPCIGEESWTRVQAHVLELKPGGDPTRPEDWLAPRPVLQRDGSPLQLSPAYPGISLDMTYFEAAGTSYVAWSQRYIVGDSIGDAEVWIATIDPEDPYRLTSEPSRLITAEYGWDHNLAAVAEGGFVVQRDSTVYMTYSGSAVGPTYVTGLLTAPLGADLLDRDAWTKLNYPVLKTDPTIDQWGPGHNSFTRDADGNLLLVYHAKTDPRSSERHTGVRRVHWAADGMPILDMKPEEEVAPEHRRVEVTVTVVGGRDS